MADYTITIHDVDYTGETASAKEQYQALHIAANSKLIIGLKDEVSDQGLVLMLMSLPWADLQTLEKLLIKDKVSRDSDSVPVAANLFRDDPAGFALLVGKAARENLQGFFALSGGKSADAGQSQASQ